LISVTYIAGIKFMNGFPNTFKCIFILKHGYGLAFSMPVSIIVQLHWLLSVLLMEETGVPAENHQPVGRQTCIDR